MHIRRDLRLNLLCAALLVAIAVPAAAQEAAQSAPDADQPVPVKTLKEITVTGSRIKRTDVEQALPITIIEKEKIDAQGITSAEQLLQFLNVAGNGADGLTSAAVDMDLGELRGTLGELEKLLDQFFRNPADRNILADQLRKRGVRALT